MRAKEVVVSNKYYEFGPREAIWLRLAGAGVCLIALIAWGIHISGVRLTQVETKEVDVVKLKNVNTLQAKVPELAGVDKSSGTREGIKANGLNAQKRSVQETRSGDVAVSAAAIGLVELKSMELLADGVQLSVIERQSPTGVQRC